MSGREFVAVKFRSGDKRAYTYHWEGPDPIACGDQVKVPDRRGDGWTRATVHEIGLAAPEFATKALLGRIEPEAEAAPEPNRWDSDLLGGKA